MRPLRWTGVVTEDGKHFLADDMRAWKVWVAKHAGMEVEVTIRAKRRPPSPRKRGYLHSELVPAFRQWLLANLREQIEDFREHYGEFTLDHAYDVLIRAVANIPEDVERVSTAIDAMDDEALGDLIFRITGFFITLGVEFDDPEQNPVVRYERAVKKGRVA